MLADTEQQEITVNAINSPLSKASTDYTGGPFGVISYISETAPGQNWVNGALASANEYFKGKFIQSGDFWGGEQPYYWPLGSNHSLIFAGYSPYTKADGSTQVSADYDISSKTLIFNDYVVESAGSTQTDLMFFMPKTDDTGANLVGVNKESGEAVDVLFRHALSQVLFNVSVMEGDEELVEAGHVFLKDVIYKGTCRVSSGNVVTWERSAEETDKRDEEIVPGNVAFLVPGESYSIEVGYNLKLNDKTFAEAAVLDLESTNYAPGYKYIYNIVIGASEITVDTDFIEWIEE